MDNICSRILVAAYVDRFNPANAVAHEGARSAGYWWEASFFLDNGRGPELKLHRSGDLACVTLEEAEDALRAECGVEVIRTLALPAESKAWACSARFVGEFELTLRSADEVLAELDLPERNPDHSRK